NRTRNRADRRPRERQLQTPDRRLFPSARASGQPELGCPESDAPVATGRDVEVGVPRALELTRRGPRLPLGTEARQLRPDALALPMPAGPIRVLRKDITGRPPSSDPLEDTCGDEFRQVVGRLRSAHLAEILITAASQFGFAPILQECQGALLSRLEFLSGGNWRHPLTPRPMFRPNDTALERLLGNFSNARPAGRRGLWRGDREGDALFDRSRLSGCRLAPERRTAACEIVICSRGFGARGRAECLVLPSSNQSDSASNRPQWP